MRIVDRAEIEAVLDDAAILAALADAFKAYSAGRVQLAAVGHLLLGQGGDCHIKAAAGADDPVFAIKIVNTMPGRGAQPTRFDGVVVLGNPRTGEIVAILHDGGLLSARRTILGGVLAAQAIARPATRTVGVVGGGGQSRGQGQAIAHALGVSEILLWARDPAKASDAAAEIGGEAVTIDALAGRADLIVTATAAAAPLIRADQLRPGARIVALGADAPGKQELDPEILASATVIVDSREQCVDHGETGWAVRGGLIDPAATIELGTILTERRHFADDETVVADLTGIAAQDLAIAVSVWARLRGA